MIPPQNVELNQTSEATQNSINLPLSYFLLEILYVSLSIITRHILSTWTISSAFLYLIAFIIYFFLSEFKCNCEGVTLGHTVLRPCSTLLTKMVRSYMWANSGIYLSWSPISDVILIIEAWSDYMVSPQQSVDFPQFNWKIVFLKILGKCQPMIVV